MSKNRLEDMFKKFKQQKQRNLPEPTANARDFLATLSREDLEDFAEGAAIVAFAGPIPADAPFRMLSDEGLVSMGIRQQYVGTIRRTFTRMEELNNFLKASIPNGGDEDNSTPDFLSPSDN